MNIVEIDKKIVDRLSAAPLAAATQGAFNTIADGDAAVAPGSRPLIIVTHVSGVGGDTFDTNIGESVYQVSVFDHRANGMVNIADVVSKVFGNSYGTDNAPTYGLHRWKMTGMTYNADCMLARDQFGTQHTADELHYWQTFKVTAQEIS